MCFNVSFPRDTWHDNLSVFFGFLADCLFWKCKYITSLVAKKNYYYYKHCLNVLNNISPGKLLRVLSGQGLGSTAPMGQ